MNLFENSRVLLRAPEPEDIDFLYELENDVLHGRISDTVMPFSRYAIEQYVLSCEESFFAAGQMRLMIETKDTANRKKIGTVELFDADAIHRRAGVGINIVQDEWRKGYAFEALKLIKEHSFNTLGLHQLFCNISTDNSPSLALFRKTGFEIIGLKKDWLYHNQAWVDVYMLQLLNK